MKLNDIAKRTLRACPEFGHAVPCDVCDPATYAPADELPDVRPVLAATGRGSLQRRIAALEALCLELEAAAWHGYGWDAARKCRLILAKGAGAGLFKSGRPPTPGAGKAARRDAP
ncbi:MAG TPA: hypothetical protein VFV84_04720 [Burkholderiales bacterium]|nr:hypothetical protein [Burkholderiales bacterium]